MTILILIGFCFLLSSCQNLSASIESDDVQFPPTPTRTPFQPLPEGIQPHAVFTLESSSKKTQTPQFRPYPGPDDDEIIFPELASSPSVWVDPAIPPEIIDQFSLPIAWTITHDPDTAELSIEVNHDDPISRWVYALTAPFPTVPDEVTFDDLIRCWAGEDTGPFAGNPLLIDEDTLNAFSVLWGTPSPQAVRVIPAAEMLDEAWGTRPSWALIPFSALEPRWKVLDVNGLSPVHKNFDPAAYPLSIPVSLLSKAGDSEMLLHTYGTETIATILPHSNWNPEKMTTLAMTGVTALVRATANTMEVKGITYPAQDIGELLRNADLTHISNEVPFARDCPLPNPVQIGVSFCSDTRYIELLENVGTDIIELTGDHFGDWGVEAMNYTLELYEERGWTVYGGGYNLAEGKKPVTLERNGNRFAFIGCNRKGSQFAGASAEFPGAVVCDFPYMHAEITRLRDEGYLVIATFQHFEYYTYYALPDQVEDFQSMAEAGAFIVSGSQAHHPQAMEFNYGAFIHYGLGNLFFDQYDVSLGARQGFIDIHIFYDGRHISTELVTIIFVDYARPRIMTPDERAQVLGSVFSASGW
ncbi:MAG: CapA family protein [Anaerolineaceae bacterium]|nr:CapA family protein [Anaerolineaceae bacterium]